MATPIKRAWGDASSAAAKVAKVVGNVSVPNSINRSWGAKNSAAAQVRARDLPSEYPKKPIQDTRAMVAKEQQFLKNRGYNLVVDGIRGDRTKSALKDWHLGQGKRSGAKWSGSVAPVDDGRIAPTNENNQTPIKRPGKPPQKPGGTQPKLGTQKPVKTGTGRPNVPAAPLSNVGQSDDPDGLFDVDVLANAEMEVKYGPVLAEYLRQEKNLRAIGNNRVAEIGDMYGTYVGDIQRRNTEAADSRATMAAATTGLAPAIAQGIALDPAAAAELAARGDIESDYAGQMNQSARDYDRRMADSARAGGLFAQGQARNETNAGLQELGAERADTISQRGADLVATRQKLEEWQVEQQFKQQQFALDKQQTEAGIQSDRLKNQLSIMDMRQAQAQFPLESAKMQADIDRQYAEIDSIMNPQPSPSDQRGIASDQREIVKDKQERKNQVLNNMYAQTRTEDGKWRVSLTKTWERAKAAMRSQGVDPKSPTGKKWLAEYAAMNGITLGPGGNPKQRTGDKK